MVDEACYKLGSCGPPKLFHSTMRYVFPVSVNLSELAYRGIRLAQGWLVLAGITVGTFVRSSTIDCMIKPAKAVTTITFRRGSDEGNWVDFARLT